MKIKKKKKKVILIMLIFLIIFMLIVFMLAKLRKLFSKEEVFGNLSNNGLVAGNSNLYFYNKYEEGIVKVKNGNEYKITDETAYSMNIVQDTIYYLTTSNTNGLEVKSVKTNGDSLKKIATIYTNLSKIYVKDGYIYYAINRNTEGICKINIETGEQNIISNIAVQDFALDKDEIFFTDSSNNLYKMNLNGLEINKIIDDYQIRKIQISGKWIYFYSEKDDALCRIRKDGKSKTIVSTFINK